MTGRVRPVRAGMGAAVALSLLVQPQPAGWGEPGARPTAPDSMPRRSVSPASTAWGEAETPEALPPGEGRDDTFYACTACHGTAVIRRAGLTRARWDELLDWMVEKQGMTSLEPDLRRVILDYLATAFPPRRGRQRNANPFMTDD
jgi:hypothetical protein